MLPNGTRGQIIYFLTRRINPDGLKNFPRNNFPYPYVKGSTRKAFISPVSHRRSMGACRYVPPSPPRTPVNER